LLEPLVRSTAAAIAAAATAAAAPKIAERRCRLRRFCADRGACDKHRVVLQFTRQRAEELRAAFADDLADLRYAERPAPLSESDFRYVAAGCERQPKAWTRNAPRAGPASDAVPHTAMSDVSNVVTTAEIPKENLVRITFMPEGRTVELEHGKLPYQHHGKPQSILYVATANDVFLDHACCGVCACGCVLRPSAGSVTHKATRDPSTGATSSRRAC